MSKISRAIKEDIPFMVSLSLEKRQAYEKAQPVFWKKAPKSESAQTEWFAELINSDNHLCLVYKEDGKISGFIIGNVVKAPEVYDPGGLTCIIDDFCVDNPDNWQSKGKNLIDSLIKKAKEKGVQQMVVVCGHHDEAKSKLLYQEGLSIISDWYHKII